MYTNGYNKKKVMEVIRRENLGRKSENDIGQCLYRHPNGNKCLAGCFIPDDIYTTKMEKVSIDSLMKENSRFKTHMPFEDPDLMWKFQLFHDNISKGVEGEEFFEEIEKELTKMEKQFLVWEENE